MFRPHPTVIIDPENPYVLHLEGVDSFFTIQRQRGTFSVDSDTYEVTGFTRQVEEAFDLGNAPGLSAAFALTECAEISGTPLGGLRQIRDLESYNRILKLFGY